jgi:small conductance mechanosensitive channel
MNFDAQKLVDENLPMLTDYALKVVGVVVLFVVAFMVAGWVRRSVRRFALKTSLDDTLGLFFGQVARWMVLLVAGVTALSLFGVETTSFAAVLGAAGLAIGLAFQGTLGHLASGVMLLVFRPFKIGDVVNVAGQVGAVQEIQLFVTVMDTADNRRIYIPNSNVFGSIIENTSHHDVRRVDVAVGTDYGADLDQTRKVLESVAKRVNRQADRDPAVALGELGDSSIAWAVRVWAPTADFWAVKDELTSEVKKALDAEGIGIPFPQMDVHLDKAA